MKVLQLFRKPYLSIFFAFMLLFVSCKQYDIKNEAYSFSLEIYNKFKNSNIKTKKFFVPDGKYLSEEDELLKEINDFYNTNLDIPTHILTAMLEKDNVQDIGDFMIQNNLLTITEIDDLQNFALNIEEYGLDTAIKIFEITINASNISQETFDKYTQIVNTLKISDELYPEVFDVNKSAFTCLVAYVLWVGALIGFVTGCATVFLCLVATASLVSATIHVVSECAGYM